MERAYENISSLFFEQNKTSFIFDKLKIYINERKI